MPSSSPPPEKIDEAIKAKEYEKLSSEVANLQVRSPVRDAIPVITALIAVGGFLFGIRQFSAEQRQQALDLDARMKIHAEDLASQQLLQEKEITARTEQEFRHKFWEE